MYSVSIAAAIDGELQAGVVLDVPHDVHYHASVGGGATANGRPMRVSGLTDPTYALIGTGFPFKQPQWLPDYQRQFNAILTQTSGVRRTGSAALDLATVAAGRYDGFWELMLAPWDIAAGLILVREAGGTVSTAAGHAIGIEHTAVVAGNEAIHAWLLAQLEAQGIPGAVDLSEERQA
jgi:myo-inositol-1(or 4)-monophosphatase